MLFGCFVFDLESWICDMGTFFFMGTPTQLQYMNTVLRTSRQFNFKRDKPHIAVYDPTDTCPKTELV